MSNETSQRGGIGFLGLLTLVFITLKLCNVIQWSWTAVLSPLWVPIAIVVALVIFTWGVYTANQSLEKRRAQ